MVPKICCSNALRRSKPLAFQCQIRKKVLLGAIVTGCYRRSMLFTRKGVDYEFFEFCNFFLVVGFHGGDFLAECFACLSTRLPNLWIRTP